MLTPVPAARYLRRRGPAGYGALPPQPALAWPPEILAGLQQRRLSNGLYT
jgi:hypothetical protein